MRIAATKPLFAWVFLGYSWGISGIPGTQYINSAHSAAGLWASLPSMDSWDIYEQGLHGGCDIVREMHETGELQKFLQEKDVEFAT